jgi:hypothetical protein
MKSTVLHQGEVYEEAAIVHRRKYCLDRYSKDRPFRADLFCRHHDGQLGIDLRTFATKVQTFSALMTLDRFVQRIVALAGRS